MNTIILGLLGVRNSTTAFALTLFIACWQLDSGSCRGLEAAIQTESTTKAPNASEQKQPLAEPQLVDGLLELIEDQNPMPSTQQDPLVPVLKMMLEVSDLLQGSQAIQQAANLQASILDQLDTLISQLQGDPSNSTASHDASSMDQLERELVQQPSSDSEAVTTDNQDGNKSSIRQDPTGQSDASATADQQSPSEKPFINDQSDKASAEATNTSVASRPGPSSNEPLDTPVELQESVWGHLPEKLRSQMQSRMVEQFLPSYRKQLESYYRKLLVRESDR